MSDIKQAIRLTLKGLEDARKEINSFPDKCRKTLKKHSVLRDIGTQLVSSAVTTIDQGGRPAYKPLAASTIARKLKKYKGKSSRILVAGGQLRQSLDYNVTGGQLFLTSVEYLKYHQPEEGRTRATFPARPVWGVHEEDHEEITDIILSDLKKT
jgi:phage gpG-like protein